MTSRMRRLYADYIRLLRLSEVTPKIRVSNLVGMPPTQFDVEYDVTGLCEADSGVKEHRGYTARVTLPSGYPREAPICHMLTPVFHPNIAPHAICIVDHWTAGESLPEMIIRIGEMLCYQSYNVKSPLNGEAAKWASENLVRFPIDPTDLGSAYRKDEANVSEADIARLAYESEGRQAFPTAADISSGVIVPPRWPNRDVTPIAPNTTLDASSGLVGRVCAKCGATMRNADYFCKACGSANDAT